MSSHANNTLVLYFPICATLCCLVNACAESMSVVHRYLPTPRVWNKLSHELTLFSNQDTGVSKHTLSFYNLEKCIENEIMLLCGYGFHLDCIY